METYGCSGTRVVDPAEIRASLEWGAQGGRPDEPSGARGDHDRARGNASVPYRYGRRGLVSVQGCSNPSGHNWRARLAGRGGVVPEWSWCSGPGGWSLVWARRLAASAFVTAALSPSSRLRPGSP